MLAYFLLTVLVLLVPGQAVQAKADSSQPGDVFPVDRTLSDTSRRCTSHQKCQQDGKTGLCCPHPNGYFFDCCNDHPDQGTCSSNSGCKERGYRYVPTICWIVTRLSLQWHFAYAVFLFFVSCAFYQGCVLPSAFRGLPFVLWPQTRGKELLR